MMYGLGCALERYHRVDVDDTLIGLCSQCVCQRSFHRVDSDNTWVQLRFSQHGTSRHHRICPESKALVNRMVHHFGTTITWMDQHFYSLTATSWKAYIFFALFFMSEGSALAAALSRMVQHWLLD